MILRNCTQKGTGAILCLHFLDGNFSRLNVVASNVAITITQMDIHSTNLA